jgi:hypothetical protein
MRYKQKTNIQKWYQYQGLLGFLPGLGTGASVPGK